jgi:hypothetical protein
MLIIVHRVNTVEKLKQVPTGYGAEIDIRHDPATERLYLNHDPGKGEYLDEWLKHWRHEGTLVLNVKEAGIERRCVEAAELHGVKDYFLLDVELPFLYAATHGTRADGWRTRKIAVRYSEAEPVEMALAQMKDGRALVDWVWVDTNTRLPIDEKAYKQLKQAGFRLCLVCPGRWGRPQDIPKYRDYMRQYGIEMDAVMTGLEHAEEWRKGHGGQRRPDGR